MLRAQFPVEKLAQLLSALAAPERLKIVRLLTRGPLSVTEIAQGAHIKPLNVAHHLAVLKNAELIYGRRRGRFVLYSFCPGVLERVSGEREEQGLLTLAGHRFEFPLAPGARSENEK